MLGVSQIDAYYGETQALFGPSLTVGSGEVVALFGPNGAGKTTTLRAILGLTPARRGQIEFDGADITRLPTHKIARKGIAWVPDDRRIFPTLTVRRNLQIAERKTRFRRWTLSETLEVFSALEHLMTRECENLSGGVLVDEPSQGLAPKIVQDVMKTILRLKDEGISVLVVEQNALAALDVCDRVYVMDRGRIVHEGAASELRENATLRRRLIGI
jgi:branched-chain amino acid transport system ATP-binding protein